MRPRVLLLLLGLCGALGSALPAAAQAPAPSATPGATGDQIVENLSLGYDGWLPQDGLAPVWLTLRNRGATEERLRVVARSHRARCERIVDLPAGAKARVFLSLSVSWRMSIAVYKGDEQVFERSVDNAPRLDPTRHLVVIDGRSAEDRKGDTTRGDQTLRVSAIVPAEASPEAACYFTLGGVLLRDLDPTRLDPDQRAALLEYALAGGSVYLVAEGPDRLKLTEFLRRLPGKDRKERIVGRGALVRDYGLGRIVTCPDDFVDDLIRRDLRGKRLGQEFAASLQRYQNRARLGLTFERYGGDIDHPGAPTIGAVVIFFSLYWLVVGPVIAIGLRKVRRRTLGLFAVGSIAVFCVLALIVAGAVRTADGAVHVRETVFVPSDGPALSAADVTVVSGGAWRYDLHLESDREFAATQADESGRTRRSSRWLTANFEPSAVRTRRAKAMDLEVVLSPWDQRSIHVVQERPALVPIEAEVVGGSARGKGYEVRVKNTTRAPFGPAILIEDGTGSQINLATGFVSLGTLAPGEEKRVYLRPNARIRRAHLTGYSGKHWFTDLDVPSNWEGWAKLRSRAASTQSSQRLNVRFVVLSKLSPGVRASGDALDVQAHALRVDPVQVGEVFERGYVGVELSMATGRLGRDVVQVSRVFNGSPAAQVGIKAGDQVLSISGSNGTVRVESVEAFIEEVGRHRPGQRIGVSVRSAVGNVSTYTLRLVRREDLDPR